MRKVLGLRERGSLRLPAILVALLLALAVIGGAFLLTRSEGDKPKALPTPHSTPSPKDHSLTNAEAIARFKELDALRRRAYESADPNLVSEAFSPNGPTYRIVQGEVQRLKKDEVVSKSRFVTRSLRVLENDPNRIRIRQIVIVDPRFFHSSGTNVTGHAEQERQTIQWIISWTGSEWLIEDSIITSKSPQ